MAAHGATQLANPVHSGDDRLSFAPAAFQKSDPAISYQPLADGIGGTWQTLAAMAQAVRGEILPDRSGWEDEYNQRAASLIVRRGTDEISALFYFVRDQIAYIAHPWNMQVCQDCRRTLESRVGDCVSKSVCLATLLACRSLISRFVAQAPNGEEFEHVYVEVAVPYGGRHTEWIALDPTGDGREERPLFDVGNYQHLPDGGFETTYSIF